MTWAAFLEALKALGWTQAKFAREAGLGERGAETVSRWQHRKKGVPSWVHSWLRPRLAGGTAHQSPTSAAPGR